jgi:hypothetical protein
MRHTPIGQQRSSSTPKQSWRRGSSWLLIVRSEFSYDPIHDHLADVLGVADDDLATAIKDCYKEK